MKIVLASASPRRQELIKMITEDIIVNPCDCDETIKDGLVGREIAEYLSKIKGEAVAGEGSPVQGQGGGNGGSTQAHAYLHTVLHTDHRLVCGGVDDVSLVEFRSHAEHPRTEAALEPPRVCGG